jgi:acyl-CoA thioester hydrolase
VSLLYTHRVDVRFADCDPLGHVNNAVYLTYLEQARFGLWKRLWQFSGETAMTAARGAGLILARVECDYRLPATYGDTLDVHLKLAGIGRTSFTYEYDIVEASDARMIAQARTVIVLYDYQAGKPVEIDDARRADLSRSFA